MQQELYKITYGSPLIIKDRPHRALDTARGGHVAPAVDDLQLEHVTVATIEPVDAVSIVETTIDEVEMAAVSAH